MVSLAEDYGLAKTMRAKEKELEREQHELLRQSKYDDVHINQVKLEFLRELYGKRE